MDKITVSLYDDFLTGKRKTLIGILFEGQKPGGMNEIYALEILRYAIEKIMRWTPRDACNFINRQTMEKLKLDYICNYIQREKEVLPEDYKYYIYKAYPNEVNYSIKDTMNDIYKRVLNEHKQFPRDFFLSIDGFNRYCYCFKYLLENFTTFKDVYDIYSYFNSSESKDLLEKYRLASAIKMYDININEVIYTVLGDMPKNKFYFSLYNFNNQYRKLKRKGD